MKKDKTETKPSGKLSDASPCSLCDGLGELEGFGGGGRTDCHKCNGTGKDNTETKPSGKLSDVSPCSLPSEFDGKFYGVGSMGKIFIRTKCGDTNVLDVRAWGYLTGRGGGLAMSNDSACEAQDKFEAWVIEALNAYRDNDQDHGTA